MRTLIIHLLATILVTFAATSASAFSIVVTTNFDASNPPILAPSDTVTVHVYINTGPGLQLLSISATATESVFTHVPTPATCGVAGPSPGCGSPTYILYSPAAGATPATLLYPQQNPFVPWTGIKPPGLEQVNINYAEAALLNAQASGAGVWVASITWHVSGFGAGLAEIGVSVLNNGNIVRKNGINQDVGGIHVDGPDGPGSMETPGEWTYTFIPEPSTALLAGCGLVLLGASRRHRRSRG